MQRNEEKLANKEVARIADELINIFQNFYLSKINIIEDTTLAGIKKTFTSIGKFFDPSKKITKSAKNPKVKLANNIINELSNLKNNIDSPPEKRIKRIKQIIADLDPYAKKTGNFAKAARYANEYLNNLTKPLPTTKLHQEDKEFKLIENTFISDAILTKKISMRLEPSRVFKYKSGQELVSNVLREITQEPPEFGGQDEFIVVHEIQSLKNNNLLNEYNQAKEKIRLAMDMKSEKSSQNLDHSINEVFLYHGTSLSALRSILQNGFNAEKFCVKNKLSGYGPLGKGTYFTDQLSKAGTFSMCGLCGSHRCTCKTIDGTPIPKIMLICKVALGKSELIIKKSNSISQNEQPSEGFHSRIGLDRQKNPESNFNSNEIMVTNDKQIYPQYAVFYHHHKNLLKQAVWEKESAGLDKKIFEPLTKSIKLFNDRKNKTPEELLEILTEIKRTASLLPKSENKKIQELIEIIKIQCDHYINHYVDQLKPQPESNQHPARVFKK